MPQKDLDKLTVVKLRAELIARGLDSKGLKPALVERLKVALTEEERDGKAPDFKMFATDNNPLEDASNDQETGNEMEDQVSSEAADQSISSNPEEITKGSNGTSAQAADVLNNGAHLSSKDEVGPPVQNLTEPEVTHVPPHAGNDLQPVAEKPQLPILNQSSTEERIVGSECQSEADLSGTPNDSIMAVYGGRDETFTEDSVLEQSTDFTSSSIQPDESSASNTTLNCSKLEAKNEEAETIASNSEAMDDKAPEEAKPEADGSNTEKDKIDDGGTEKMDDSVAPEGGKADVPVVQDAEVAQESKSPNKRKADERNDRGSKRHRDRSSSPSTVNKSEDGPPAEDEPEWDGNLILLDWYNSDLNLSINKTDFLTAAPLIDGGFAYMWAGARGTYGFHKGKVCFEVKILENLTVAHLEESEPNHHLLRAGWSVDSPTFQLGEEPMSYGYGGTAKISQNSEFKDYGVPFQLNDVVGIYLDAADDKETVDLLFTVNGEPQGVAFSLTKEELEGRALYPHVLTKNCRFEVNFGLKEEPWFQPMEGFEWAAKVPVESRVRGPIAPATRAECQMIMMCGLPGAGKTTWANKFTKENADKKFNVIGTNAFLEKMKVNGLARRKNYSGRWEALIEKCTRCLNILLDVAAKRRRNFILDQTNVYPTAQKRKMSYFAGFQRKAIVIVPTDEEYKVRAEKRIQEEGKDVPDSAVMEMKANFKIPSVDDTFTEVDFPELDRDEALKVTEKYSTEAKAAGYGQPSPKRQRQNYGNRKNDRNDSRRHGGGSGGRDRNRDSRGSNSHRSQNNSSSSRSSYRDSRDDRHRPPPPPHWRGGGGGPGRGGGWNNRGPPPPPMHRNGPYSPRRGPPLPPGPMVSRGGGGGGGGWSAPPLDRSYPGGGRSGGSGGGRSYGDDRRNDRSPYPPPAQRRDVGGPSPWMNSASMASSGPQRSSGWASQQQWNSSGGGGGGSSSSSPYGQSQQSSYASASYGGSALYGSAPGGSARPVASSGYGSMSSAARPLGGSVGGSYGSSVSGTSRPAANYGGAGITGLARPATNYGSNGPARPANNSYGAASSLPGSRPSSYVSGGGARPVTTSYPTGSINSWSQQQQQQQQPPTGYQYASYTTNQSTYSGGK